MDGPGTLGDRTPQLDSSLDPAAALVDRRMGCAGRSAVWIHRAGDEPSFWRPPWPQGDSIDTGRVVLQIPVQARSSAEALSLWLQRSQKLDVQSIRKGAPRGAPEDAPEQWNLSGGNARESWVLQYAPGADTVEVKHNRQTWMAAFNRLHKSVGGGLAWTLLGDSFAIGMLLLGLSGLWMWARGRNARQMIVSVLGASLLVVLAVLGPALL
jgi:hypothetical protein